MVSAIHIENLHKSFRLGFIPKTKKILKGISLSVTTIKCILGLIFPNQGEIELFGHHHLSLKARAQIGFLPENPYFYDHLTASEFLYFYSQLFLIKKNEREKKIKNLIRVVGLEESANLQLRKFSRGMMQRIGLAQALLNEPSLVILDEPLGGLDPIGRKEIRDIIVCLKEEGKTVFLSSHILQDIEMICDRVAIIVNGEIINQGALQDLISEKILFTEIVISGVDIKELENMGEPFSERGGRTLLKVFKEGDVEKVLKLVASKKGKIHSLIPRTETLEDLFVEIVKQR